MVKRTQLWNPLHVVAPDAHRHFVWPDRGQTLEWTAVAASGAVPAARMLHSAAVEGQRMWVFGGYDGTGSSGGVWGVEEGG